MYKKILLAIDLSYLDSAKQLVKAALELTAHNPDTIYRVVTIIEPLDDSFISAFLPKNFDKSVIDEANKALHQFTKDNFPASAKVQHIVAHGTIYEEIDRISQETSVDLIMMLASHKPESKGISNNTAKVARYCDKPLLIVR